MEYNLSDETLDHLRFHLDRTRAATAKLLVKSKRRNDRARYAAHLAQLGDLLAIFEPVEPAATLPRPEPADVIVTPQGSVYHFDLRSTAAIEFVRDTFATEPWQWLGDRALGIDHRYAPQVVCQLRDNGFEVEVR